MKREEGDGSGNGGGASIHHDDDNPLLEQMNIIRGYINDARKELRFEEVITFYYLNFTGLI